MWLQRALILLAVVTADVSLRDKPIASASAPTYLDGTTWTASTQHPPGYGDGQSKPHINITIPAKVPGDLLTDLQRAKVIQDPWLDITWIQNSSLWTDNVWTYSTSFTVSDAVIANTSTLLLTFDGVKMGATVRANGHTLGVLRDQVSLYHCLTPPHFLLLAWCLVAAGSL